MARLNSVMLLGFVLKDPEIMDLPDGNRSAICHVCVGRGARETGDGRQFMKLDDPIILTKDRTLVNEIATWKANTIVEVYGVITGRAIRKSSYCPKCGERNVQEGALVFVTPIDCKKRGEKASQEEAIKYLSENREFSNKVLAFGTLCVEPKKVKTKEGIPVTRFQVAMNRKYYIRDDSPEIKADYPFVYAYGKNAVEAKMRLGVGAEIFIDGCLQTRTVPRQAVCATCGETYKWTDRAMEIVPYQGGIEYISGYKTDEMLEKEKQDALAEAKRKVFGVQDDAEEDDSVLS